jgi:tetratricopeptide (TPR) repeat protein
MRNLDNRKRRLIRTMQSCALFIVASLLLSQPAKAQDALWRSYYTSAQSEYQRENYIAAKSYLSVATRVACKTDETLSTYYYLANICVKTGDLDEAEKYYRMVLEALGTKTWAVLRPPDGTPEWDQSATITEQTADGAHFLSLLSKAPPELLTMKLAKPITIVDVLSDYGSLLLAQKRFEQAEEAFNQALILADCRPDLAVNYEIKVLQKLCVLYELQGRKTEAESVKQQLSVARNTSIPDFDKLVGDTIASLDRLRHSSEVLAIRLNNLALFCAAHGDYARAQSLLQRAVSCLGEKPTQHKKERARILHNYSDLLLAMGRSAEANALTHEAALLEPVAQTHAAADRNQAF